MRQFNGHAVQKDNNFVKMLMHWYFDWFTDFESLKINARKVQSQTLNEQYISGRASVNRTGLVFFRFFFSFFDNYVSTDSYRSVINRKKESKKKK